MGLLELGTNLVLEWPVRKKSTKFLINKLSLSGKTIISILREAEGFPGEEEVLRHVIGIEKWGQRRLKVALGEKLVEDEYDLYRPPYSMPWAKLIDEFADTRARTVQLAKEIELLGQDEAVIPHNDWGDLTVRQWLRYLEIHAHFETGRIR